MYGGGVSVCGVSGGVVVVVRVGGVAGGVGAVRGGVAGDEPDVRAEPDVSVDAALCDVLCADGGGLYVAGWRKGSLSRMVGAFLALTVGMLVHYSAGPYLLFLVMHYLVG